MPDPSVVPLALYVHIPWCERKCPYCDFNSHEHFDPALETPYVEALLSDLRQQIEGLPKRPLTSIFIGGGTPSLFSARAIGTLLSGVNALLDLTENTEVTLECNPGSAEADRYRDYRLAGVNRLSIGIQSFDDAALKRLGRIHDSDQARRAIDLASHHFDRFNIDLMHGLPGQDCDRAEADLREGIARSGGHLSWYQLTIEPNTAFWSRPPTLPVEDILVDIQDRGEALLNDAGFTQYEVSAWARPGQQAQHNLNYWTFGDYIGVGAGAHGKITLPDGSVERRQRTRLPRDYLRAVTTGTPPLSQTVAGRALAGEFMLNALRLTEGVSTHLLTERTGLGMDAVEPALSELIARGLLADSRTHLVATEVGFRFLNDVVGAFLDD